MTHTLAFAISVQLSIVTLWCISFWEDGKLVVSVHVNRVILHFAGAGQGTSVAGWAARPRAHAHQNIQAMNRTGAVCSDDRVHYPHGCFVTSLLITSGQSCFVFLFFPSVMQPKLTV